MASIIKWEPLNDLVSLHDAMDRLFEGSFVRMSSFPSLTSMDVPALDVYDTKDNVEVKVTVPGVKPEDLDITITGDVLTITGESRAEQKVEKGNYIRQERRYGAFQRSVQLPGSLIADKAEAKFEHGVLTLTIPKSEESKPKTIKVETAKA